MATVLIGLHDLMPFLQVYGKAVRLRALHPVKRALRHHDHSGGWRGGPALLRGGNQHVDARLFHVDPGTARRDAVQHQNGANLMRGIGQRCDVIVRQDDAGGRLHMRGEDHIGLGIADAGGHFLDGRGSKGCRGTVAGLTRHADGLFGGEFAGFENLRPAVGEPAVAHDQHMRIAAELPCDRLHRVAAATGHKRHRLGLVDFFQHAGNIAHHALKGARHVVQRPVGENDRIFQQSIGIDGIEKSIHIFSPELGLTPC